MISCKHADQRQGRLSQSSPGRLDIPANVHRQSTPVSVAGLVSAVSSDSRPSSPSIDEWHPYSPVLEPREYARMQRRRTSALEDPTPPIVNDCKCQCEVQADVVEPNTAATMYDLQQQTTHFSDMNPGERTEIAAMDYDDASFDQTRNIDLVGFLSRPVRILNFTWNESDAVGTSHTVSPWNAFFTDPRIQYKLNNFAFIRCTLKVKVLINSSPFYYGAMMMSYQPLPTLTPTTITNDTGTRYLIPYSQRPHIWINPQDNAAGEMTLPFFYQQNFINAQSAQNMTDMGLLTFLNYTTLQSANGVSGTGVNVAVYAWAENVKLSGPSVGIATQSEEFEVQSDEYGNGVVSAPASAIAAGASYFESIPIIGRFATATRIGASAIASIASMFGFTNVPVISDTEPLRPEAFPKMSSSEIGFPVEKLTLDPKNELTVDPTTLGLNPTDELAIPHLVQRESYLTSTNWTTAQTADTILFTSLVNPHMFDTDGATNSKIYMTPPCWVSALFEHWRGDIIFKFKVVASKFHRGRLKISFDPSGQSTQNIVLIPTTTNVVMTSIIDLGDSNEIEFRVPYQQAITYLLKRQNFTSGDVVWNTTTSPSFSYNPNFDNGTICVRVLTALTAPVAAAPVSILVSVRGAENLEFGNPCEPPHFSMFAVQSEEFPDQKEENHHVLGTGVSGRTSQKNLLHFGETICSLRQLLRRSTLVSTSALPFDTTHDFVLWKKVFTKIPGFFGFDPNGINSAKGLVVTTSNFPFNYSQTHPLTWLLPAFVAYRGSTIWSFNTVGATQIGHVRVFRDNAVLYNVGESAQTQAKSTSSSTAAFFYNNTVGGATGQAVTNQQTNAGINVLCPNYAGYRLQSTNPVYATAPSGNDGSLHDQFVYETLTNGITAPNPNAVTVWSYCGIGTDFNMYFFLNVPTLWAYTTTPTPN